MTHTGHLVGRFGGCKTPNIRQFCPECEAEQNGYIDYPMETYRHPDGRDISLRVCVWRCAVCKCATTEEDVPERVLKS